MKKFLAITSYFIVFFISGVAFSGEVDNKVNGFFQIQSETPQVGNNLTVNSGIEKRIWRNVGVRSFALAKKGFAQGYIGPIWMPFDWFKVGFGLGLQQVGSELDFRSGYILALQKDWFSFCAVIEVGEKAYTEQDKNFVWYDFTVKAKVLSWLTVGLKDRRPSGVGPLLEVFLPKTDLKLWTAWTAFGSEQFEFQSSRFMFGTIYLF